MQAEHAIGVAGAAFFMVCGLLLLGSVRRGSELCRLFAEGLPDTYAEVGSPRPGYFDSPRRHAYFRFIMQRRFEDLNDPLLLQEFSQLHRSELRKLVFLVAGFAGFGLAFLWLHYAPAA
jgi:hypothetical protein